MTVSQTITITEAVPGTVVATAAPAEMLDIVSTLFSTNSAVTGMYGLLQRGGLLIGGMALQSKLKSNTFNFLK